ncbi:hypothetical protein BAE44_0008600 [Dichanthelium oligosanthes]|uniref:Uncharacterized protein n=1 Tax=Dichanthelium oligosanthes TaxID=888268 RepID=A0A1E5VZ38_9POAL|nr:hypothetical protein BAE44_0008600 [Dichanthelium oligosanthes]
MQSGEQEAPEPAALSEAAPAAVAPEPALVGQAADEPAAPVSDAAAAEAPRVQEAEAPAPVDGGGSCKCPSPSPAPASPSTVKERQIPVDPASLRRLGMVADEDSPLSAPSVLTEVVARSSPLLPPLRRPTFVGASLPCSAASSPVHGASAKWEDQQPAAAAHSPTSVLRSLARQHSAALARLVAAPSMLSRSASRAEGRAMAPHDDEEPGEPKLRLATEDGFTCGSLCMFIPGFSRKKPTFAAATAAGTVLSSMQKQQSGLRPRRSSASRVASLERFECGSWSPPPPPAPVAAQHDGADCLAMEVAKTSCAADDAEAPVKMAFVFDGEPPPAGTRGILKNSASSRLDSARPSTSSQRHVRFSTAVAADAASCPTSPCITPRLARARAEFNAFLEAQSA